MAAIRAAVATYTGELPTLVALWDTVSGIWPINIYEISSRLAGEIMRRE